MQVSACSLNDRHRKEYLGNEQQFELSGNAAGAAGSPAGNAAGAAGSAARNAAGAAGLSANRQAYHQTMPA